MSKKLVLALALATLTGCPPGKAADTIRTEQPSAAEAMGETKAGKCTGVEPYGKPLVVDLKAEARADFEVAMTEGVAVVRHDCQGLALVEGCNVEGAYGYVGVSPKEEMVRLASSDELGANLPISAGAFGAKLGAELDRGATLDIAMMMVGKRRTTRKAVVRNELVEERAGACKAATHFIRGATLGAFVMDRGSRAKVRSSAELFGIPNTGTIGVKGGSASSRESMQRDGSVDACKKAAPDGKTAPPGCSAVLRLELAPIEDVGGANANAKASPALAVADDDAAGTCPAGLVFKDGKCAAVPTGRQGCKRGDLAGCSADCDAGSAQSCGILGSWYFLGRGTPRDTAKASVANDKGCKGGDVQACAALGVQSFLGEGVAKDPAKGTELLERACKEGYAEACAYLGRAFFYGEKFGVAKDASRAASLFVRGCDGGGEAACYHLGLQSERGDGVPLDLARAASFYKRGCDGDDALACDAYGQALHQGRGVPKDIGRAATFYRRTCEMKGAEKAIAADGCTRYGILLSRGIGVPKDAARGREMIDRACMLSPETCPKKR